MGQRDLADVSYFPVTLYLTSPLLGAQQGGFDVDYVSGVDVTTYDTSAFAAAVQAVDGADVIIFAGGLDETVERKSPDRLNVTWPRMQLELVVKLDKVGKPIYRRPLRRWTP